jgi:hypothetical protein
MGKTYRYKDLSFPIADGEAVNFTVKFISDGNTGQTVINIPGPIDPQIADQGTVSLGQAENLRNEITVSYTDLANLADNEDEIKIQYLINGQLLKEHVNKKSEEKKPTVVLNIRFPKPA